MALKTTETKDREKMCVWLDNKDVAALRALYEKYDTPVSSLIRWYVKDGLENKRHPVQK
jgi:hypothetical protein